MKHLWFEKGAYASKSARQYIENEFQPEKIKNITVIRHAALGDQVIVRPFLIEAKKFFPNAKITLVGASNYQYGIPSDLADETIIMAGKEKSKELTIKEKLADYRQLPEQDIIFDVAGTTRSYWLTFFSKAKIKMGFPYKPFMNGTLYNMGVFRSDFQPEVECMLDMLKILGHAPTYPLEFAYPDHRELRDTESPYVVYFNGASQLRKILPQDQMKEVLELATNEVTGVRHIFLEGKNDFEKGDFLKELVDAGKVEVQPCLPLDELIEFIAKASVVVAPDTGIRNVAIATHTPTVGIFYATVPFRYTPLYETHLMVMNANGTIPSKEQIVTATHKLIESTGNDNNE